MDINLTGKGKVVLTNNDGETLEISNMEFWDIVKFGDRLDIKNEVENYLEDDLAGKLGGVSYEELLNNAELLNKIIEEVITNRTNNESADQIFYAAEKVGREYMESKMDIEPQKSLFDFYKIGFNEMVKVLPDGVVSSFEDEKKAFLLNIDAWVKDSDKEDYIDILKERVDRIIYNYVAFALADVFADSTKAFFDIEIEAAKRREAIEMTVNDYTEYSVDFLESQLYGNLENEYLTKEQYEFLINNMDELEKDYICRFDKWFFEHPEYENSSIPLDVELDLADMSINAMLEKEIITISAYPLTDNHPPTLIDISKRDLKMVISEVFDDEWPLEDFLVEYDWDSGEQIKEYVLENPEALNDSIKVTDYADANYEVIITNYGERVSGDINENIVARFYPARIDKEFISSLIDSGYEGYHIIVGDFDWGMQKVYLDCAVEPNLHEDFYYSEDRVWENLSDKLEKTILAAEYATWEDLCVEQHINENLVNGDMFVIWGEINDLEEKCFSAAIYKTDKKGLTDEAIAKVYTKTTNYNELKNAIYDVFLEYERKGSFINSERGIDGKINEARKGLGGDKQVEMSLIKDSQGKKRRVKAPRTGRGEESLER